MVTRDFSGRDVVSALDRMGYEPVRQRGSHVILKYEHPETGEVRTVSVPQHDRVRTGTLRKIAEQCGARDFEAWCAWIDEHR